MRTILTSVLLSLGLTVAPTVAEAQSVKLNKLPAKKSAAKKAPAKKPAPKKTAAKKTEPKRSTASTKKTKTPAKPKRATITSKGSTLGSKSKTHLPVKAAGEAQKKKETQFKRRKKTPKKK